MNRKVIIVAVIIISLIVGYYLYGFFYIFKNQHYMDYANGKKYLWIFQDSVKADINDPKYLRPIVSWVKERDVFNAFFYKKQYGIIVWEFKDLSLKNLKDVTINQNMLLGNVEFKSREVLDVRGNPEINVKLDMAFKNKMMVNLDGRSKIIKSIESANYKGFYGIVNRMTFSDENYQDMVLFDYYKGSQPTFLLLYGTPNSFYVIMIGSEKYVFDENIIKIFNLK